MISSGKHTAFKCIFSLVLFRNWAPVAAQISGIKTKRLFWHLKVNCLLTKVYVMIKFVHLSGATTLYGCGWNLKLQFFWNSTVWPWQTFPVRKFCSHKRNQGSDCKNVPSELTLTLLWPIRLLLWYRHRYWSGVGATLRDFPWLGTALRYSISFKRKVKEGWAAEPHSFKLPSNK